MGMLGRRTIDFIGRLPQESRRLLGLYPVEMGLMLLNVVGWLALYACHWDEEYIVSLTMIPLFAILALSLNRLTEGSPWRKIYWVCWTPLVPLLLWGGLVEWAEEERLVIAVGVLAPLMLLMCRRALDNDRFVADALIWLRSAFLAALFSNVALGLFWAIVFSTVYIFSLNGTWIHHLMMDVAIVTEAFLLPILFLAIADRGRDGECRGNRVVEVLLNWIVTPALLIYGAILYLYIFRIVALWSLPRGGVAYLVFAFMLFALVVKGMQSLLPKRIYAWFFDRLSLLALPMVVLFWVGTQERLSAYGLTAPRVWLVVCGALMTFCVVLFLSRRAGRYLWVALAGFLTFGLLIFVPPIYPKRVALRAQTQRAERLAIRLGLFDDAGHLDFTQAQAMDSLVLRKLYRTLSYLEYTDSATFDRFGSPNLSELNALIGEGDGEGEQRFSAFITDNKLCGLALSSDYKMLYTNLPEGSLENVGCRFENDTLYIRLDEKQPPFRLPATALVEKALQQLGTRQPTEQQLNGASEQLLVYDAETMTILFSSLVFEKQDGELKIRWLSVDAVLTR